MNSRRAFGFVGLLALITAGCGGASDNVEVFPVKGIVTYNGKPMVGGGSISFVPTTKQKGKGAGGVINSDGTYILGTYAENDGSMIGDFRVVITQVVYNEPQNSGDSDSGGAAPTEPTTVVAEADRIPAIYSDHTASPLTAKVEAKNLNEIDFSLEPGKK